MYDHPRVIFDTNEGSHGHGHWLDKDALKALGADLREGLAVIIVMPDELEMQATLRFDPAWGMWLADPAQGTIKYLDGT